MKMKFFFSLLVISSLSIISCGDDDGNVNCSNSFNISSELADEVQALNDAATAYALNPNSSTCNDYKDAANDYLDAVESLQDCANQAGQGQEFQQSLQAAQASVDAIQC